MCDILTEIGTALFDILTEVGIALCDKLTEVVPSSVTY